MKYGEDYSSLDDEVNDAVRKLTMRLGEVLADCSDPRTIFQEFTRELQRVYDITKGFLALREGDMTRFLAVATFSNGTVRKNLSLRLPNAPSLFEKVAESGQLYTENFAELCDGNLIERRLLLDDDTRAFMLRPLKHEGRVIGLLGYSSENPDAFVTFEEGLVDPALDAFGRLLGRLEQSERPADTAGQS